MAWSDQPRVIGVGALLILGAAGVVAAQEKGGDAAGDSTGPVRTGSGFAWLDGDDTVVATVSRDVVQKGVPHDGHPRDLIRAIDEPRFYASTEEAERELALRDHDRVIGVVVGEDARAYPTRILDRHEVANDTVGGKHLAVVW